MESIRWYDRNSLLKEVFIFIQKLDTRAQNEIAQDIIQILMNNMHLDLDEEINLVNKNYTYECKRWYDKNPDLHTAFEIIKGLPDISQKTVINMIVETALLMYFGQNEDL